MNGCAPGLAVIERLKATRKWAISNRELGEHEKTCESRWWVYCAGKPIEKLSFAFLNTKFKFCKRLSKKGKFIVFFVIY